MSLIRRLIGERPRNIDSSWELDRYLRQGTPTWAGVDVSPTSALQLSAVFDAQRIISEDIGKIPVIVYQSGAERARAETSPFWRLIKEKPNTFQTSQQFRELLTGWAVLRGNGCSFKLPLGLGQVRELLPIQPERLKIEQLPDHEVLYHVTNNDGTVDHYTRRDIFHVMGPSLNGYEGVSVVGLARETIGWARAMQRHGATLFGNGAHPSGVLEHPGPAPMSDDAYERLRQSIDESHSRELANKTLILEEGMKWKQTTLSNEDSQFLQSQQFGVVEIARWFRLPPHKLGDLSRATWANIEHQQIEYLQDVLMVWAERWDSAFNQQVIGNVSSVYAETLIDAVLRGSTLDRFKAYQIAAGRPWMTPAEVRRRENLPPMAGLDEVANPLNMSGAGSQPASDEQS